MNQPIVIDFETFYDSKDKYTLKKLSTPEYVADERFCVTGLAVDDGGEQHFLPPSDIPEALEELRGHTLVMHNAHFDAYILNYVYDFRPAYMIDTLLLANHVHGPAKAGQKNALADVADRLGIEAKGRLDFMDGVREPDEAQFAALAAYAKTDVRITRQVLDALLPSLTRAEFELWLADHTIRLFSEQKLELDPDRIEELRERVTARRTEYVKNSGVTSEVLMSNDKFGKVLQDRLAEQGMEVPMKKALPRKDGSTPLIPAISKSDPAFLKLAESDNKDISVLVKARLAVRSSTTIQSRLDRMANFSRIGGIPIHLVYYGAKTGRYAGGGGFNFQNLTSPARATDPIEKEIATDVRRCFVAGEGRVFVAADASQIEARLLAWMADEREIVDTFAKGEDIYSKFISGVLGEDIHKPTDDDPADQHGYLKLMRHVGKESILGLGYSMGAERFRQRLEQERSLWSVLAEGGRLSADVTEDIVKQYRDRYKNIKRFWYSLFGAFMHCVREGRGSERGVGPLLFRRKDRTTIALDLPSGRSLYYNNVRYAERGREVVHGPGKGQKIYGGILAENCTQAVARDVLAEAILAAEQAGYPVLLSIHDELICRIPEGQGEECLQFLIETLSRTPEWADRDLILAAEGHIATDLSK